MYLLYIYLYSGSNYKESIYLYLDQDRISSREISKNLERTAGSSSFHQSKLFIPVMIFAPNNKMRIFSYRYIHSYRRVAREYNRVTVTGTYTRIAGWLANITGSQLPVHTLV